ncbi:hypothetical protein CEUSTIGMA_g11665.t1 [Chlamydomonas eustigma]|uniref:Uncharacterized protein n=1 Tax=Chlamydomonas eustigma TaxID=1157962 RepID=A0A250XMW0_9CHLO|nr:hypothetical protein CEUSTIGMA_g11665.t1 [Chlamydomonas eustigma]|eukprot:GAX84242.1 hypothetical protein CEUSTIGMA_g11665.t1 [Chlamydomonas eustigma]
MAALTISCGHWLRYPQVPQWIATEKLERLWKDTGGHQMKAMLHQALVHIHKGLAAAILVDPDDRIGILKNCDSSQWVKIRKYAQCVVADDLDSWRSSASGAAGRSGELVSRTQQLGQLTKPATPEKGSYFQPWPRLTEEDMAPVFCNDQAVTFVPACQLDQGVAIRATTAGHSRRSAQMMDATREDELLNDNSLDDALYFCPDRINSTFHLTTGSSSSLQQEGQQLVPEVHEDRQTTGGLIGGLKPGLSTAAAVVEDAIPQAAAINANDSSSKSRPHKRQRRINLDNVFDTAPVHQERKDKEDSEFRSRITELSRTHVGIACEADEACPAGSTGRQIIACELVQQAAHQEEVQELKGSMAVQQAAHQEEVQELKNSMNVLQAAHQEEVQELKGIMAVQQAAHQEEVQELKGIMAVQQAAHQEEVQELKGSMAVQQAAHQEEVQELKNSMNVLQAAHQEEVQELKNSMNVLQAAHQEEVQELKNSMNVLQAAHQEEVQELKNSMSVLQAAHQEEVQELKDSMAVQQASHQEEVQELKDSIQSLRLKHNELEATHASDKAKESMHALHQAARLEEAEEKLAAGVQQQQDLLIEIEVERGNVKKLACELERIVSESSEREKESEIRLDEIEEMHRQDEAQIAALEESVRTLEEELRQSKLTLKTKGIEHEDEVRQLRSHLETATQQHKINMEGLRFDVESAAKRHHHRMQNLICICQQSSRLYFELVEHYKLKEGTPTTPIAIADAISVGAAATAAVAQPHQSPVISSRLESQKLSLAELWPSSASTRGHKSAKTHGCELSSSLVSVADARLPHSSSAHDEAGPSRRPLCCSDADHNSNVIVSKLRHKVQELTEHNSLLLKSTLNPKP